MAKLDERHAGGMVSGYDRRSKRQRESADAVARYLGEMQARVMKVFWERGSATVRELWAELTRERPLAYTTALTVVNRLWTRGLLEREPEGRGFRYRPAHTRDEFFVKLSDELIDRLVGDFGEIGVARLGERLSQLDRRRRRRLARESGNA